MEWDEDTCYRALTARDARFDGRFFVGVLTTGIYCRPVCPARTPHRRNVRFLGSSAAAVAAGFRACRRCRPDTLPTSREWDHRGDLVARALRMIGSGAADDGGTVTIAQSLAVTPRHLNRSLMAAVGATVGQLARTRRAQAARLLLVDTALPLAEVAYAAGFGSVRQFNDVMRTHFGMTPSQLRAGERSGAVPGELTLRLRTRPPYAIDATTAWVARHGVPGVDSVVDGDIATTTSWGATIRVRFEGEGAVAVSVALPPTRDVRALPGLIDSVRRWLDLDANPALVDSHLSGEAALSPLVARRPGLRVVGTPDPFAGVVRTIVGQQVSVAAAGTQGARLAQHLTDGARFPTPDEVAAADPVALAEAVGVPKARGRTIVDVAQLVASGHLDLDPAGDRDTAVDRLRQVRGVGPWTLAEVRMRCLGDPDAWPDGDLVLRRVLSGRMAGLDLSRTAPWRSYVAHHVWVDEADRRRQAA